MKIILKVISDIGDHFTQDKKIMNISGYEWFHERISRQNMTRGIGWSRVPHFLDGFMWTDINV